MEKYYYNGKTYPSVNIKVHRLGVTTKQVAEKFNCSEAQAEQALEFAFETEQDDFAECWCVDDIASYFPKYNVKAYIVGRNGGHLIVDGLPDPDEWDKKLQKQWDKFEHDVEEDIQYRISAEVLLGDIQSNRWAEEGASKYNFVETPKGDFCYVDIVNAVNAFSMEQFGINAL